MNLHFALELNSQMTLGKSLTSPSLFTLFPKMEITIPSSMGTLRIK